jgi:hypothetical protein
VASKYKRGCSTFEAYESRDASRSKPFGSKVKRKDEKGGVKVIRLLELGTVKL